MKYLDFQSERNTAILRSEIKSFFQCVTSQHQRLHNQTHHWVSNNEK